MTVSEEQSLMDRAIWRAKHFLSIEPMLLIFCTGTMMSEALLQNFLLFLSCDKYNDEEGKCDTELKAQSMTSVICMARSSLLFVFWIVTTNVVGSLVDHKIRYLRWLIFVPAVGQMICDVVYALNDFYFKWSPVLLVASTILVSGFTGQQITAMSLMTTYVSHTSTVKNRSQKIGYVVFAQAMGMALGNVTSGYVLKWFTFGIAFLVCAAMQGASLIAGLILVEDLSKRDIITERPPLPFIEAVKDGWNVIKKKRSYHRRTFIISLLIVCTITQCYQIGEATTLYLFLRNKFNWESSQFGLYMFFALSLKALGALFINQFCKVQLRLRDATIGIIASLLEIISHSMWLVAFLSWQTYVVAFFGVSERVIQMISMSLASKCVAPEEYGRLGSLFALTNLSTPLGTILYNCVYQLTLLSYPAGIFLISVSLCLPLPFIFWLLLTYTKQTPPQEILRGEGSECHHLA